MMILRLRVIIQLHVFSEDDRAFYNIERIWRDGKEVDINSL